MPSQNLVSNIKELYTDILSQCFSPCGNFLAAGSVYGRVHIFDIRAIVNPPDGTICQKPAINIVADEKGRVCAMLSTDKFLIIGSVGKVIGFEWKPILAGKPPKVSWSWDLPKCKEDMEMFEVNALALSADGNVYVGCGDNKIHVYSLEDGRLLKTLTGHTGYIHDLQITDQNQLFSCGEDGTVRIWDTRTHSLTSMLEPYQNTDLERPPLGKWVGSLFIDKQWLLCGGGVRASLWHIPSLQLTTTFPTNDLGIHACMIHEERILLGGQDTVDQFTLLGEKLSSIRCSSHSILSIAHRESPHNVLSIAGTSPYLDFCTSFEFRERVLSCF